MKESNSLPDKSCKRRDKNWWKPPIVFAIHWNFWISVINSHSIGFWLHVDDHWWRPINFDANKRAWWYLLDVEYRSDRFDSDHHRPEHQRSNVPDSRRMLKGFQREYFVFIIFWCLPLDLIVAVYWFLWSSVGIFRFSIALLISCNHLFFSASELEEKHQHFQSSTRSLVRNWGCPYLAATSNERVPA